MKAIRKKERERKREKEKVRQTDEKKQAMKEMKRFVEDRLKLIFNFVPTCSRQNAFSKLN